MYKTAASYIKMQFKINLTDRRIATHIQSRMMKLSQDTCKMQFCNAQIDEQNSRKYNGI